jgi:chaperone BCS1
MMASAAVSSAPIAASSGSLPWVDRIMTVFNSNPYFHAGAGLYVMGMLAFFGRYASRVVVTGLKRRYVVSMETTNRDASYSWMMEWLASHPTFSFQQMSIITSDVVIHANEEISARCTFAPCPNVPHVLVHQGWPMLVQRKRQMDRAQGADVLEVIELYTLGRNGNVMQQIVRDAQKLAASRDAEKTVIYHNTGGRWTRHQDARQSRPLSSVVLDGNTRETLVDDVKLFLSSKDYYHSLGVPYRRGYLLHGPPGCGKSSLVMAIAGELRLAICVLSLSNRNIDDESLNSLLNSAPQRSIILLEDIDRAFTNDCRVTMSGVLNALDGVSAQEGKIVFMTTNHVERLSSLKDCKGK